MNIPSKEYTLNIQRNRMTNDAFHAYSLYSPTLNKICLMSYASNCHFIV